MRWNVEDSGDFVVIKTDGVFNLEDHRAMVSDVVSQPFWQPGRDAFFDHRTLRFDGVGYQVMLGAVGNHMAFDEQIGNGRAAVLMSGPAAYGLGRIFDSVASDRIGAQMRIFTDEAVAQHWLLAEDDR